MEKNGNLPIKPEQIKDQPELSNALNRVPRGARHIHIMGICGTGMASLAGMLKEEGYLVSGSDKDIYPPMNHFLEELSIPLMDGYSPGNLHPEPDLVIVGNVITRDNPEAMELARLRLPYLSFPQALRYFAFKDKRSIVISGTHGKTTTSALVAWILERAGWEPGFMIGGIVQNFQKSFKLGEGQYFVIEGDEYDTAFFDKGPKFLHYSPWATILTSIEFDHADIYRDLNHVITSFRQLIRLLPQGGLLIANADDKVIVQEIKGAECVVLTYGFSRNANWRIGDISTQEDFTRFKVFKSEDPRGNSEARCMTFTTPLYGRHNLSNLLSALVLADFLDIPPAVVSEAARSFRGVKRRQEVLGERRGVLVIDDFAHHPTSVKETIGAVRGKYKRRRLVAVFEPRSNSSRRNIFQTRYASSFDYADLIMIPEPPLMEKIPPEERFSSELLVRELKDKGLQAFYFPDTDLLLDALVKEARTNDLILIMSNGGFDNLTQRLLEELDRR